MAGRSKRVFVTGATGYIGRALIPALSERGHDVFGLVRKGSQGRLPKGCRPVIGDALQSSTYEDYIYGLDSFVHLVGVSHPSPSKAKQFRDIDLRSAQEAVQAAVRQKVRHFVYLSVAHPAPIMGAYIEARIEGESVVQASGLSSTILRPWYVLGPGHRWPMVLIPLYWVAGLVPSTRSGAQRPGLVKLEEMVRAITLSIEEPAESTRIFETPDIRRARLAEPGKFATAAAGR